MPQEFRNPYSAFRQPLVITAAESRPLSFQTDHFSRDRGPGLLQPNVDRIQQIKEDIAQGKLVLSPAQQRRLDQLDEAEAAIAGSRDTSEQQKADLLPQVRADKDRVRSTATAPSPEQIATSPETQLKHAIQMLPQQYHALPWQQDPKTGMLQLLRGWKPEAEALPDTETRPAQIPPPSQPEEYEGPFRVGEPPPPGVIPPPLIRTRKEWDRFGGGWFVDIEGNMQRKSTRDELKERAQRKDFGDVQYEYYRERFGNRMPVTLDQKTQKYVIDPDMKADLIAQETLTRTQEQAEATKAKTRRTELLQYAKELVKEVDVESGKPKYKSWEEALEEARRRIDAFGQYDLMKQTVDDEGTPASKTRANAGGAGHGNQSQQYLSPDGRYMWTGSEWKPNPMELQPR